MSLVVGAASADYLAANSGAAYLYFNACNLADLILSSQQITNANYETQGSMFSTQTGENISIINYDAGFSIHLNPSFSIDLGTEFHAFIDGCF